MSCNCCASELLYLKHLKDRFDAIDAQLELLIQAQERANAQAQAKIDAAVARGTGIAEAAEATAVLPEG